MNAEKAWDGSESRPYRGVIGRRTLPHEPPLWVNPDHEVFFITICCKARGTDQLCNMAVASILFDAARYYDDKKDWFVHVMMLMPDHLHMLATFAPNVRMPDVVRLWKRYTARTAAVQWQRDFFDHRLRRDESWREKADYILANPVRAGLVRDWREWPYVLLPHR